MNTLKVQTRDLKVKAKKLRREGYITGNLYGKNIEKSIPLKFARKESEKDLRGCGRGTQIMLDVEGKLYDALIKDIAYDSAKNQILEIDFQALVSNEKVHSVAEIIVHNKEKVQEGVVEQVLSEVSYRAYPSALVDKIEIDAGEMHVGDTVKVKDLAIACNKDIDLQTDPETTVVTVFAVHTSAPDDDGENGDEPAES